jgi:hypothetical protein
MRRRVAESPRWGWLSGTGVPLRSLRRLAVLTLIGGSIAACGGDKRASDGAARADSAHPVRLVAERYARALAAGDGRAACAELTLKERRETTRGVAAQAGGAGIKTCAEAVAAFAPFFAEAAVEVGHVKVSVDTATATLQAGGPGESSRSNASRTLKRLTLVNESGRWRIDEQSG